jgi:diacylglycerol diphosphate phosphatase/phosphatidate phosphatase
LQLQSLLLLSLQTTEAQAGIYTVVIPLVVQICVALFVKKNSSHVHYTWCAYAMGLGSTMFITEVLKRYVGRLRPNTYDYCGFDLETLSCTQNDKLNWRTSFPSGHSSVAFCGCTLLTWYLCYAVNLPFTQQHTMRRKLLAFVVLSPMLLAFAVSASRIVDNYHFVGDGTYTYSNVM